MSRRTRRGLIVAAGAALLVLAHLHLGRPLLLHLNVWLGLPEDTLSALKALLAFTTLGLVLAETIRRLRGRPFAPRRVAIAAGALATLGAVAFVASDDMSPTGYHHLWEFFHYYNGAKYHRELGYKRLYYCAAVVESELGTHNVSRIRDLETDAFMPVERALSDPDACRRHFTPERWAAFREDIRWFLGHTTPSYWTKIQSDHGYNPPPLWTTVGSLFASHVPLSTLALRALASIDVLLLCGLFFCLWWAFGWRVLCLAIVFFGVQVPANGHFTAGAFLRQDWLFLLVLSVCLARRGRPAAAGASLAASSLLRVFPALLFAGPLVIAVAHLVRHRRLARPHLRFFIGAAGATLLLGAVSVAATGFGSYPGFVEHIRLHSAVPLSNNMGLRVIVGRLVDDRRSGTSAPGRAPGFRLEVPASERQRAVEEPAPPPVPAPAPARRLQRPGSALEGLPPTDTPAPARPMMRAEAAPTKMIGTGLSGGGRLRSTASRVVFYSLAALLVLGFALVVRRLRTLWIVESLGLALVVFLLEPTCYYYSFFLLAIPLSRAVRRLEIPILIGAGLSAAAILWTRLSTGQADRYAAQSVIFVALALTLLLAFARRPRVRSSPPPAASAPAAGG